MIDMRGKVCVITGATSGIGRAAALALGRAGADLFLLGRNGGRAKNVLSRIRACRCGGNAEFLKCDLSSWQQIRDVAAAIRSAATCVDVLINNAGARFESFQLSADNVEMTFAVNHLGHFLLTALLLDRLLDAPEGRVINVSGERHRGAESDFEKCLNPLTYDRRGALSTAKLANLVFTFELAARLRGAGVCVNAVHPGAVATRASSNGSLLPWLRHMISHLLRGGLISAQKGADTLVYLAASPEVKGGSGQYYYCRKPLEPSLESKNSEAARRLWEISLKMTHLDAAIGAGWRFFKP